MFVASVAWHISHEKQLWVYDGVVSKGVLC